MKKLGLVFFSLLIVACTIILNGKYNFVYRDNCNTNAIQFFVNEQATINEDDLNKLNNFVYDNNLIYLSIVDSKLIDLGQYDYYIMNIANSNINTNKAKKCFSYFKGYKNDFINKALNYNLSYINKIEKNNFKSTSFALIGLTNQEIVEQEFIKNKLIDKFSPVQYIDENIEMSYEILYYNIYCLITFIFCILLLNNYLVFRTNSKEYLYYKITSYSYIILLKKVLLPKIYQRYFIIVSISNILLFIYYRMFNLSFIIINSIIIVIFLLDIIINLILYKNIQYQKSNRLIKIIFLATIVLIVNLLIYKNLDVINISSKSLKDNYELIKAYDSNKYFEINIGYYADEKQKANIYKDLYYKNNGFNYFVLNNDSDSYTKIETNFNYFNVNNYLDENSNKIRFDNSDSNCYNISVKELINIIPNNGCKLITLKENQIYSSVVDDLRSEKKAIVFVSISNKYTIDLMYIKTNSRKEANRIQKEIFLDNNYFNSNGVVNSQLYNVANRLVIMRHVIIDELTIVINLLISIFSLIYFSIIIFIGYIDKKISLFEIFGYHFYLEKLKLMLILNLAFIPLIYANIFEFSITKIIISIIMLIIQFILITYYFKKIIKEKVITIIKGGSLNDY